MRAHQPVPKSTHQPLTFTPASRGQLQRKCACGNTPGPTGECAACRRQPLGIQTKLTVSQPGDKYEQEADRIADQVMRMPEPRVQRQMATEAEEEEALQAKPIAGQITPLIQRQVEPEEEEDEEEIQMKPLPSAGSIQRQPIEEEEEKLQAKELPGYAPAVTPRIQDRINALRGGGQPLPESVRGFFEPRFGHSFADVRIHSNARTSDATRALQAQAFTLGRDIYFGAGQYQPRSGEGRRLLAHELVHVRQQGSAREVSQIRSDLLQRKPRKSKKPKDRLVIPWDSTETGYEGFKDSIANFIKDRFSISKTDALDIVSQDIGKLSPNVNGRKSSLGETISKTEKKQAFTIDIAIQTKIARALVERGISADKDAALEQLRSAQTGGDGKSLDAEVRETDNAQEKKQASGHAHRIEGVKEFSPYGTAVWLVPQGAGESKYSFGGEVSAEASEADFKSSAERILRAAVREAFSEIDARRLDVLLNAVKGDIELTAPDLSTSREQGVETINVMVDIGQIQSLLIAKTRAQEEEFEQPTGILFDIKIPVASAEQAQNIRTAIDLIEAATEAVPIGTATKATTTFVAEVVEQTGKRAARQAGRLARQVGRAAKKVPFDHQMVRKARSLLKTGISDHPELVRIWESVRQIDKIEDFARTKETSRWAKFRARQAFNAHRRRFWEKVAENSTARGIFTDAGFEFPGKLGTAPVFPGLPVKFGRVSIEHVAKIRDNPFGALALDPRNLTFLSQRQNTFLDKLEGFLKKTEAVGRRPFKSVLEEPE